MIPLTIPEIKRLLAALTIRPLPLWHIIRWDAWTRRHQARQRMAWRQNREASSAASRADGGGAAAGARSWRAGG